MAKKESKEQVQEPVAPAFPVFELIANSYEVFRIPRHVAVGAIAFAGKSGYDMMTADEFKRVVRSFLNRRI